MKDKKYAVVSQEDLELIRRATAECAAILIPPDTETEKAVQTKAKETLKIINRAIERASDPVIWARLTNNGELWDRSGIQDLPDGEYNFCVCPTGEEP